MRKLPLWLVLLFVVLSGCSTSSEPDNTKFRSVSTELTKQQGLEHWKLVMLPKTNGLGEQAYDIEFQYTGEASVKGVTVYYRIDTEEKLSAPTVKADSKTVISKLDPNEKITLSELILPIDVPVSVEVDWLEGNRISRGTGVFKITELK